MRKTAENVTEDETKRQVHEPNIENKSKAISK